MSSNSTDLLSMICSQTHLIAIGTGSGLAILTAPLTSHAQMEMLPTTGDKPASDHEMTVLVHLKGGVSRREYVSVHQVLVVLPSN